MKVGIIGTVGIGKSTVSNEIKRITKGSGNKFYIEREKYAYLEKMYSDMEKWGYIAQIDFLMLRLRSLHSISREEDTTFFDRTYIDDYLYADVAHKNGQMTDEEFETYQYLFDKFNKLTIDEKENYDAIFILQQENLGDAKKRREKRDRYNEKDLNHFIEFDDYYEGEDFYKKVKSIVPNTFKIKSSTPEKTAKEILNFISSISNS